MDQSWPECNTRVPPGAAHYLATLTHTHMHSHSLCFITTEALSSVAVSVLPFLFPLTLPTIYLGRYGLG